MEESPWVPFGDKAAIRHLAFDTRSNTFSNILWIKKAGVIGTHKHRGTVVMVCLEGSARYLEYDWVARPRRFHLRNARARAHAGQRSSGRREALRLVAGRDRVLRRQRQLHRDARCVVVHQPLRDVLPRARHSDQQAALYLTLGDRRRSSAGSRTSALADRPAVGGKGGSLGELTRAGIAVPPGFVVRPRPSRRFLAGARAQRRRCARAVAALAADDLPPSRLFAAQLRARIDGRAVARARWPKNSRSAHAALARALRRVGGGGALVGDDRGCGGRELRRACRTPICGCIDAAQMLDARARCWASLYSVESISYRRASWHSRKRGGDGGRGAAHGRCAHAPA